MIKGHGVNFEDDTIAQRAKTACFSTEKSLRIALLALLSVDACLGRSSHNHKVMNFRIVNAGACLRRS
jgi:hypothetical protein